MSTIFAYNTSGIAHGGMDFTSPSGASGHSYVIPKNGSGDDFTFTGTELEIFGYGYAQNVNISVDGGAVTQPTIAAGFNWNTLVTGLTEGTHTISIRFFSTPSFGYCLDPVGTFGCYRVTGVSPAIGALTNLNLAAIVNLQTTIPPNWMDFSPGWNFSGGASTYGIYVQSADASHGWNDAAIRFKATTQVVAAFVYGASIYNLRIDGVDSQQVTPSFGNLYLGWIIFPGLDGTTEHTYEITVCLPSVSTCIGTIGVSGSFNTTLLPSRQRAIFIGDSITETALAGSSAPPATSLPGFPNTLAKSLKLMVCNMGIGGLGVYDNQPGWNNSVSGSAVKPDFIVIELGTNDMNQGINGDHRTQATVQTSYQTLLAGLLTATSADILCIGILPRAGFSQSTIASWDACITGAIAAAQAAATVGTKRNRITYVDPYTWLTQWGDFQADDIHPTVATGWPKMAAQLKSTLSASFISTPSPAAGSVGIGL